MSILIKNGRIVTATDDYIADVFIEKMYPLQLTR
jgi:dihydroorotase-like cyclic amidohydrolase